MAVKSSRDPGDWVVLDAGKQGLEHFEFNRGILLALQRASVPFCFVAMQSMYDAHANDVGMCRAKIFKSFWNSWPRSLKNVTFKLFSVLLAGVAVALARQTLLVLYATPVAHVILALASHLKRIRLTIFLHAEIEFLAVGSGRPRRLGEMLMQLSLRWSSPRVQYLTFTSSAAACVGSGYGLPLTMVCPHPMAPALVGICAVMARAGPLMAGRPPVALAFFKSGAHSVCVRQLCNAVGRVVALNVNGYFCTLPYQSDLWSQIETLLADRPFLGRRELERNLLECSTYLLPAAADEYQFTASGLACSAASAGAAVVGCANPFMMEYEARYPTHFKVLVTVGEHVFLPERPNAPIDNLDEVAHVILGRDREARALPI